MTAKDGILLQLRTMLERRKVEITGTAFIENDGSTPQCNLQ